MRLVRLAAVLAAVLLCGYANAQQKVINCVASSSTACNTSANPGNGTQGDPAWLSFGKTNANFAQLYGMFGGSSHLFSTGTATAADLIALWTGCSGTQYLGADGACHSGGGGSGTVNPGTTNQIAFYSATGTAVSGSTTLPTSAFPAISGDVTISAGTTTATVSKVNGASLPVRRFSSASPGIEPMPMSSTWSRACRSGSGSLRSLGRSIFRRRPPQCACAAVRHVTIML